MRIKPLIPLFIATVFFGCSDNSSSTSAASAPESSATVQEETSSDTKDTASSAVDSSSDSQKSSSSTDTQIQPSSSDIIEDLKSKHKSETYYDPDHNILIDGRDDEIYTTVVIGEQTWMAQNLRYTPDTTKSECMSVTVESDEELRLTCGNMYNWLTIMNLDCEIITEYDPVNHPETSLETQSHQGICPEGWHVPSEDEWRELLNYVDDKLDLLSSSWSGYVHQATNKTGFNILASQEDDNVVRIATSTGIFIKGLSVKGLTDVTAIGISSNDVGPWIEVAAMVIERKNFYVRCLMD